MWNGAVISLSSSEIGQKPHTHCLFQFFHKGEMAKRKEKKRGRVQTVCALLVISSSMLKCKVMETVMFVPTAVCVCVSIKDGPFHKRHRNGLSSAQGKTARIQR